jgi:hypothetical protein
LPLASDRRNPARSNCWLAGRGLSRSTISRPMSMSRPYWTPEGQVVSQLRQVRQRSRWSRVTALTGRPSSICFIK